MRLNGKVAIVTGSSKGIGRGIAEAFAREGCKVVINARSLERAENVASSIRARGSQAIAAEADVTHRPDIERMVQKTIEAFGRLDILVNNAGISMVRPAAEITEADWNQALKLNLTVHLLCAQCVFPIMSRQEGGRIINITSVLGKGALPGRVAYCVSKAGANMMTMVLAVEWAKYKINVNAIAPAYIRTELVQELLQKNVMKESDLVGRTPLGRLGDVQDVAGAAVFLASDEARYITGTILRIDGGWLPYAGWEPASGK
jgi:NAD(P)-dependent dehydrogenase (short-subunit alcohol dehydrogenase family)